MIHADTQAPALHRQQALEARFGLRVAAVIDEAPLGHDIQERLRIARENAVSHARSARRLAAAQAVQVHASGTATLGGTPWWARLASFVPLLVLSLGLLMVIQLDTREQIHAAAEIDTLLLADSLPPRAYTDPGFAEFLKQVQP